VPPQAAALIKQLQSNRSIRFAMLGRRELLGSFMCGVQVFGHSPDHHRLYAWVLCADFRTGSHAKPISGSRLAGQLTVTGAGSRLRLVSAAFPRDSHRAADIRRLFPADVRRYAWTCGPCDPRPTLHEMLLRARSMTESR
jgi:hypothetical protein